MDQKDKVDYHLFTTNHPYFIELGLGSFTLSTLIDWWNQQDHKGRYLNRRHINSVNTPLDVLDQPPNGLNKLLGITENTEFFWYGWKPNLEIANAGRFQKQTLRGILSHNGGDPPWSYTGVVTATTGNINDTINKLELQNEPPLDGLLLDNDGNPKPIRANPYWYYNPLYALDPLYSVIQLNKYISLYDDFYPRETWSLADPDSHKGLSQAEAFGSWAFINEIKSGKGNPIIQWSGDVTFFISQNNGLINQCPITDNVQFTLYLVDESMTKSSVDKSVTVKNMVFVGSRTNPTGPNPAADGELQTEAAGEVAAPIDLQYNPISKKWQSGNVNMLAKLTTAVGRGKTPSLDYLLDANLGEMLQDEDNKYSYIPASGSAMPIRAQNSMPLQWSPNYAQTEDTRCVTQDKTKQFVTVYNFNPKKAYPSGEEVLLTHIDGIWHVSDLGRGDDGDGPEVAKPSIGKWGAFTYMMTSQQFFFKGLAGNNVTPRGAEHNFHYNFYNQITGDDNTLNFGANYGPEGDEVLGIKPVGGYDFSTPFNTTDHQPWSDLPGYLQVTSFDFLDSKIFGVRGINDGSNDVCTIATTSATVNSAGKDIPFAPQEYANRNSAHAGVFFGCVFPNGYKGTEIYNARDFTVDATGIGVDANSYLNTKGDTNNNNPFNRGDGLADRNACNVKCLDTQNDPTGTITIDGNNWTRMTTKHEANIFYNTDRKKSIPADVMLNASPKGKHGSPIKPIQLYRAINTTGLLFDAGVLSNLTNGGVWLHKRLATGVADLNDSAFDFEPDTKDNLMFRPLKLEAYLQFGVPYHNRNAVEEAATKTDLNTVQDTIVGFYAEAARTTVNHIIPVGPHVAIREFENTKNNIAGFESDIAKTGDPLKFGAWVPNKESYSRLHDYDYWNIDHGGFKWTATEYVNQRSFSNSNWRGAGAFGIITTSQKVTANTTIEFTTSNRYGMGAAAWPNRNIVAGSDGQERSWGASNFSDSYKQRNIIDLSVRIYQGHPEHLTVYDPRYFAVHHFNEGVDFLLDQYQMRGAGTIPVNDLSAVNSNFNDYKPRNYLQEVFTSLRNSNGSYLQNVTYVYPEASGADYRVPSRWEEHTDFTAGNIHTENGIYHPVSIPIGLHVMRNATRDPYNNNLLPPPMDEKYWVVDTRRNGKLLPYKYHRTTLGVPFKGIKYESNIPDTPAFNHTGALIIKNGGAGFNLNDTIGILEYNVIFKVTSVNNGSIDSVDLINRGRDIPVSSLPNSGDLIGSFTPKLQLRTLTGNGTNFNGYFVAAEVYQYIECDPKPFLIKRNGNEINRIAADEPGPSHPTIGSSASAEPAAFVEKAEVTTYTIPEILKSTDNTYDIFFHFHNDISFTWLACGSTNDGKPHGSAYNITECAEQHITLEKINLI